MFYKNGRWGVRDANNGMIEQSYSFSDIDKCLKFLLETENKLDFWKANNENCNYKTEMFFNNPTGFTVVVKIILNERKE